MDVITSIPGMKRWTAGIRQAGNTVGFVPTMGYLHEGHLNLVRESLKACDRTAVSIFVNPTQFGEGEDLDTYPKNIPGDKRMLEDAGVDALFLPNRKIMYPEGYKTYVEVEEITDRLCGKSRPGFFRGVTTIVLKLFNIVQPDIAFFGEKDRQQLIVIQTMAKDLNLDVEVRGVPIVREKDGLAMSSRNSYLSREERKTALSLSQALEFARREVHNGAQSTDAIRMEIFKIITSYEGTEVDYISLCDPETFVEQEEIKEKTLVALAVRVGQARLIDNCLLERTSCNESC